MDNFSRVIPLIKNFDKLKVKWIAIVGVGGVGGVVAVALARSGVCNFILCDFDKVNESNINRQVVAKSSNVGESKVKEFEKRIKEINPECEVKAIKKRLTPENIEEFNLESYDYIVDAIDMMTSKIELICYAKKIGVPIISALGAGNKMDPTKLEVSDIYKTSYDPLGKILRKELRLKGVKDLKVVYSKEVPTKNESKEIGSLIWVTASMGLIIAKEVITDLIK